MKNNLTFTNFPCSLLNMHALAQPGGASTAPYMEARSLSNRGSLLVDLSPSQGVFCITVRRDPLGLPMLFLGTWVPLMVVGALPTSPATPLK